ncbi:MAG TPA: hypothetical protein VEI03_10460 [Stellaceae bacterium]|nr:hypothetical protein [Stellaceae bacterium]
MSSPINLTIRGHNAATDAPTVEDLLGQVEDWFNILLGVEQAIAEDGVNEVEWRVTNARMNSPLAFELTPFPRKHGMDVEQRVKLIKEYTANGLVALRSKAERPTYFTEPVLKNAERLFKRVTNGLSLTAINFGDDLPRVEITPSEARAAIANTNAVLMPKDKPYRETGSIEGTLTKVERDGYGRPLLFVKLRLDGEAAKCIVGDAARTEVERHEIGDIWKNQRIRVFGVIYYKGLGRIAQIDADNVQFLPAKDELPSAKDIIDEKFTGGLRSEEYLERLRNGDLS